MANSTYDMIMSGKADTNIRFADLQNMLASKGFICRVKGDHYIYRKAGIPEIVNIQPIGNKAKPYQIKQIRNLFLKYGIWEFKNLRREVMLCTNILLLCTGQMMITVM